MTQRKRTLAFAALAMSLLVLPASAQDEKEKKVEPTRLNTPRVKPIEGPSAAELEASIKRGVDFLVGYQNDDGSWGNATRTKALNIYAPVPGAHHAFKTGTTALCIAALIESGSDDPKVKKSLDRAEQWLTNYLPRLKRANPTAIYNVWGHAYSIQALVRMHRRHEDKGTRDRIAELIRMQFDRLTRYESVDGGWGYYDFRYGTKKPTSDSISFVNATVLVAFAEAKAIGLEPPKKIVDRAIAATLRQRKSDFSYLYGEYLKYQPARGINRPGGSLGRSQACNIALRMWGDEKVTDKVLDTWLHRLFARNGWLSIGRKRPIPHEAWFQVAGYFYYYGHYYGALCIEDLPESERGLFQAHMAQTIIPKQEKDGSWWDYPLYDYHQPYGTGFALMTLVRCRR
ncbi:MAG: terpene cyclase/mutase family protein [Planctomycetes bacterium]|nr:terpene cyclase/mutase family protein [Planctomycetota bacterium]